MKIKRRGNNEGTIFQRSNGKWRAQVTLKGHRLGKTSTSRIEAQEWVRQTAIEKENGLTIKAVKMSYAQFLSDWLQSAGSRLTQGTHERYSQLVRDYILPSMGHVRLRELTPNLIQSHYNRLVANGIGLRTAQKTHTVIHASLNAAMKMGLIGRNPDDATQPPRPNPRQMLFLTQEQVHHFLAVAKETGNRNYALYFLAIVTGMRQGELLGLRWKDVDFDKETITVQSNLQRMPGGGLRLQTPKTKTSIRTIRLGSDSMRVLAEQKEQIAQERETVGFDWKDEGFVFPSSSGTAMDCSNLWKNFRRLVKQAELPKIRFHDLRHTAASLMLNNGVDVLVASNRLGHAKPSITLDVYGHLIPSMQTGVAEVLDSLVVRK